MKPHLLVRRQGGKKFFSVEPVRTLRLPLSSSFSGEEPPHCLSVSWHRGPGHAVIAAGYSNGSFALWKIANVDPDEDLNYDAKARTIYPYVVTADAHTSGVTTV